MSEAKLCPACLTPLFEPNPTCATHSKLLQKRAGGFTASPSNVHIRDERPKMWQRIGRCDTFEELKRVLVQHFYDVGE